jgi:hypothetical protein
VAQDCLIYNPLSLGIVDEGSSGWLLTNGVSRMHMFDNLEDAQRGWALTVGHTGHCFIGRGNDRPNREDYIVEYWAGASGIQIPIPDEDCISYDKRGLRIVDEGANGWLLTDGRSRMLMLDNREAAERALDLARSNKRHPLGLEKWRSVGRFARTVSAPYQTCHRRFQQWVREGALRSVLEAFAEDLRARGELDFSECFIDGMFVVAKKGGSELEKPSGAKVRSSWQWQTALVFLSPFTQRLLRRMKSPLSRTLSSKASSTSSRNG